MSEQIPTCTRCFSRKRVIPAGDNVHTLACLDCKVSFEDLDDGDIGRGGRPDVVAERREEFALREKARRERRMQQR